MPMHSPIRSQDMDVVFSKEQAYSMRFRLMYFSGVVPTYLRKNACEISMAHMQVFRKAADPQILRKMLFDIAQGIRNQLGMTACRRKACRFQQIHKKSVVHFG